MKKPAESVEISVNKPALNRWAIGAFFLIFVFHSVLAVRMFPTPGSIVDRDSPVLVVDHAIHEDHGTLGARFLRESGRTWGYDPFFMAGYPETPIWDSSSNPSILFCLLDGGVGYRGYKVGLLASSILVLFAVAGGAWAAGLRSSEVVLASGLFCFVFWTGFSNGLWRSGLFAFVSASAGVGLLLGLCVRFDRSPSWWGWVLLSGVGSGLFFVHVTAPILAIGGLLTFLVASTGKHPSRWFLAITGAGFLAVLFNLFWLIPLWRFRSIRTGSSLFMTSNSAWYLLDHFLYPSVESRAGLILLVLGSTGLLLWCFTGRRSAAAAFGGSIVLLLILTGFGSLWGPTRNLEPLRFRVSVLYLLAVPAASSVVGVSSLIARWAGGKVRGAVAVLVLWSSLIGVWAWREPNYFPICWWLISKHRPLVVGVKPEMRMLVDAIRSKTDLSGRILFEDQLRLLESTDPESTHWTPLLPELLGQDKRMFIGGIYQTAFIKHHDQAAFGDFQLGDRPIDEWTSSQFRAYADRYNLGWVVCWSPLSRFWFDNEPTAHRLETVPRFSSPKRPVSTNEHEWNAMIRRQGMDVATRYMVEGESSYAIYRIDRARSYFLRGKGKIVNVEPDRIELADVEPEGGAVVLSMHWLDTWVTEPPLVVKPEPIPPDPVDFVRIEMGGPMKRLVLRNAHRGP